MLVFECWCFAGKCLSLIKMVGLFLVKAGSGC